MLLKCHNLEVFSFKDCTSLKSLSIESDSLQSLHFPLSCRNVTNPVIKCKKLQTIDARSVGFSTAGFADLLVHNQNLRLVVVRDIAQLPEIELQNYYAQYATIHLCLPTFTLEIFEL